MVLAVMWAGVTLYAVFAGADFGAGFWDLFSGGARGGKESRALIERSLGPVWEANHVWLIFVLVILWTGFPAAFAAIASVLYIPLTVAAAGIILRGAGFVFRKPVAEVGLKRIFGAAFAASSIITPFFLGAVAGAVASGRVPAGPVEGMPAHPWTPWTGPTSLLGGTLAVVTTAFLGAVFLAVDAQRQRNDELTEQFRRWAMGAGLVAGAVVMGGIGVLANDAPRLFAGLTGRALPLVVGSAVAGIGAIVLLWKRRFVAARLAAVMAVVAVVWGWAAGQYPEVLVGELSIAGAAGSRSSLMAMLVCLAVGAMLFVPPLTLLLFLHARGRLTDPSSSDQVGESDHVGKPGGQLLGLPRIAEK